MTDTPALRIDIDGTVTALPDASYETIHLGVGGWIEAVPTDGRIVIWVNEEGKLDHLPFNPLGHALWAQVDRYGCIAAGDWLAGPCVVTGPADDSGNTTSVADWVMLALTTLAATIRLGPANPAGREAPSDR